MTRHDIIMACAACFCFGLTVGLFVATIIQRQANAAFNRIIANTESETHRRGNP